MCFALSSVIVDQVLTVQMSTSSRSLIYVSQGGGRVRRIVARGCGVCGEVGIGRIREGWHVHGKEIGGSAGGGLPV